MKIAEIKDIDLKTLAIYNATLFNKNKSKKDILDTELQGAFPWNESKQGHDFWSLVNKGIATQIHHENDKTADTEVNKNPIFGAKQMSRQPFNVPEEAPDTEMDGPMINTNHEDEQGPLNHNKPFKLSDIHPKPEIINEEKYVPVIGDLADIQTKATSEEWLKGPIHQLEEKIKKLENKNSLLEDEVKFRCDIIDSLEENEKKFARLIDKVTTNNLGMALRMCSINITPEITDKIIDLVEIIEEKGNDTSIMDIAKIQEEWEK